MSETETFPDWCQPGKEVLVVHAPMHATPSIARTTVARLTKTQVVLADPAFNVDRVKLRSFAHDGSEARISLGSWGGSQHLYPPNHPDAARAIEKRRVDAARRAVDGAHEEWRHAGRNADESLEALRKAVVALQEHSAPRVNAGGSRATSADTGCGHG